MRLPRQSHIHNTHLAPTCVFSKYLFSLFGWNGNHCLLSDYHLFPVIRCYRLFSIFVLRFQRSRRSIQFPLAVPSCASFNFFCLIRLSHFFSADFHVRVGCEHLNGSIFCTSKASAFASAANILHD